MQWLSNNQMKANPDKCQLSTSSNKESGICIDNNIINNKCGKLLGVNIDQKLNFNAHSNDICKKAGQKLNEFSKITFYIDIPRRRFFAKCLMSQFSYCPFCGNAIGPLKITKINCLHETCLRIIYCDKSSTFEEVLDEDGSVTINKRNL